MEVFTAGHSNRTSEELRELLADGGVRCVADVRRFPVSRRFPQHRRARLAQPPPDAGIEYVFPGDARGGGREPQRGRQASANSAWSDPALRAFADALDTP